jgi:LysM repeat protein
LKEANQQVRLYIVKAGDTLSSIAEKYGLELAQLLALNPQITDPDNIMPGMKIKIAVGPVSIAPVQPEGGHPINPVGQETETPFMQFPVPAMEAGGQLATGGQAGSVYGSVTGSTGAPGGQTAQTGAGLSGMTGYQQNGWSGETGMGDVTGWMTGTGGTGGYLQGGMSSQGTMPGMGDVTDAGLMSGSGDTGGYEQGVMNGTGAVPGMGDVTGTGGTPGTGSHSQGGIYGDLSGNAQGVPGMTGELAQGMTEGQSQLMNGWSGMDGSQPYLTTIPQNFAGNPLYGGVGAFGDVTNVQGTSYHTTLNVPNPQLSIQQMGDNALGVYGGTTSNPNLQMGDNALGVYGGATSNPNLQMGDNALGAYGEAASNPNPQLGVNASGNPNMGSANVPNIQSPVSTLGGNVQGIAFNGTDNVSANIHTPYMQPFAGQLNPMLQQSAGWPMGWPETYTWSAPFDYMAANNANLPLSNLPNQLPAYQPNIPVSGLANQAPNKKPCGCGGKSSVGYYSLAEKRRAEEAANAAFTNDGSESLTPSEEARIAGLEQRIEELNGRAEADQAADDASTDQTEASTNAVNTKQATGGKRSRSRTRKRTGGQKKSGTKVHLHGIGRTSKSESAISKPWLSV